MHFLITLIILLIVVGLALWLIGFLPIDGRIKQIISGIIIAAVVIYLLLALLGQAPALPRVG